MLMTAQDIDVPESDPDHPDYDSVWYPSREGWDQRFGYGRVNSYFSVKAVWDDEIPPEADIVFPDWFRVVHPDREPSVTIRGRIAAERAESYDYTIEWARGVEPAADGWETLAMGTGMTEPLEGDLHTWDVSTLEVDNQGEVENRFTVTIRIRVTANYADGPVAGETRRAIAIHRDPDLRDGFPLAMGVRNSSDFYPGASGEGAPKLADLDDDGDLEILYGDADGLLHVVQADGSELAGFPVQLGVLRGHDPDDSYEVTGSAGYVSGDVPSDDLASSLLATPAVGDLDGDGTPEIIAATVEGDIYAVNADGSMRAGFPIPLPEVLSSDPLRMGPSHRDHIVERGVFASPALSDLDDDGSLEIIVAAFDGHLYVFREDGSNQPGFPVEVTAPILWVDDEDAQPGRIMTSPAIGDANGDGIPDIAIGSNEKGDDSNSGAIHLFHGDGNLHEGGAEHPNWPINLTSLDLLPLVGEGTPSAVAMADANDDGRVDLAITASASRIFIVDGIQPARGPGEEAERILLIDSADRGPLSNVVDPIDRPVLNTFASGSFGDLDQDGAPDFMTGGAGLKLAGNLAGGYANEPFQPSARRVVDGARPDQRARPHAPGLPAESRGLHVLRQPDHRRRER